MCLAILSLRFFLTDDIISLWLTYRFDIPFVISDEDSSYSNRSLNFSGGTLVQ
ncbi:hypothetical protein CpB0642 [Chlamydia pneumoniae TW-183]|uniref:Uncharacterized protein n=1 Tax=Chlamydia pneumoniae TaxID=83558 RepID=A0ABM5LD21_CHLPN|nr:hypothetical protein CpB0642 [Chlamydia pneumoniae TW-183]